MSFFVNSIQYSFKRFYFNYIITVWITKIITQSHWWIYPVYRSFVIIRYTCIYSLWQKCINRYCLKKCWFSWRIRTSQQNIMLCTYRIGNRFLYKRMIYIFYFKLHITIILKLWNTPCIKHISKRCYCNRWFYKSQSVYKLIYTLFFIMKKLYKVVKLNKVCMCKHSKIIKCHFHDRAINISSFKQPWPFHYIR